MVEMIVVLVVLGVLVLIAVPAYLGFSARAAKRTAAADVRTAVTSAEAYHTDYETYAGMTVAKLKGYDSGLQVDDVLVSSDGKTYCLDKTVGTQKAFVIRGAAAQNGGEVAETGLCPASL